MNTFYLNPFYMFSISFISVMAMFCLKLSGLYHDNNITSFFILLISLVSFLIGLFYKKSLDNIFKVKRVNATVSTWPTFSFIIFGFFAECYFSGGIPLLSVLAGVDYDYQTFGIKTFHVFYMGVMLSYSILSFERYLESKRKLELIKVATGIFITIAIVSRGATMLIVIPMVLIMLSRMKELNIKFSLKMKLLFSMAIIVFVILFGYLGDKRMVSSGYESNDAIYDIGMASDVFKNYDLPSGFFWVYLYATSPYATLIAQEDFNNIDKGGFNKFLYYGVLPDFISKYSSIDMKPTGNVMRISPELTVSTGFGRVFSAWGYLGILCTFLYMSLFIITFTLLNRKGNIRAVCAILTTASMLMIFDNMIIFSACIMQLLMLTFFSRAKISRFSLI